MFKTNKQRASWFPPRAPTAVCGHFRSKNGRIAADFTGLRKACGVACRPFGLFASRIEIRKIDVRHRLYAVLVAKFETAEGHGFWASVAGLCPARVSLHLAAGLALLERNPRIGADDIFGLFGPFNAAADCVLLALLQP
jgi:hypothetical protein